MRIAALILLLGICACSGKSKITPEKICQQGTRACTLADAVCTADAELGAKEVCTKRGEVCGPLRLSCSQLVDGE